MSAKRLYLAVAAAAIVVYLGALWNRFAMDDLYIIAFNPLVRRASGLWQAFGAPYWPPSYGGKMYRPPVLASFRIDRLPASVGWVPPLNPALVPAGGVPVPALPRAWGSPPG